MIPLLRISVWNMHHLQLLVHFSQEHLDLSTHILSIQIRTEMLKLNRHGLRIFMDGFQGCYKDGKDGGPDRRFFAGLYFIFRLIVFIVFDMTSRVSLTYMALLVTCVVFSTMTVFFQPYKRKMYTYLDVFFFNLLTVIMGLQTFMKCKQLCTFQ